MAPLRLLLGICLLLLLAPAASASPPAKTLVVTPSTPHVDEVIHFSGCGYGANKDLGLWLENEATPTAEATFIVGLRMDAAGCFDTATLDPIYGYAYSIPEAGDYEVYANFKHGSGISDYGGGQPVAETAFTVVP